MKPESLKILARGKKIDQGTLLLKIKRPH